MNGGLDEARARRSALERLGARIPGFRGYLERELRRDVDKMQRDWLAGRLDRARGALGVRIREWSRGGHLENLDLASGVDKALDRLANRIRHADYGASGFFDVVKIREPELDRLYEFDLGLADRVDELAARIAALPGSAEADALDALRSAVSELDLEFDRRATVFEDVTREGGR